MKQLVLAVVAVASLSSCGSDLTAGEACERVEPDLRAAAQDADFTAGARVLRDVANDSEDDVARVFNNAAESLDYFEANGNEGVAPDSVNDPLDEMTDLCNLGFEG